MLPFPVTSFVGVTKLVRFVDKVWCDRGAINELTQIVGAILFRHSEIGSYNALWLLRESDSSWGGNGQQNRKQQKLADKFPLHG